jgi:hypothetical protein
VEIGNANVLDLTNAIVRQHISVAEGEITITTQRWRHMNQLGQHSVPQQIGAAARNRPDVDGILFPCWLATAIGISGLPHLENLVLFMDPVDGKRHRNAGVTVRVHDPSNIIP